jgi:hypothetical protein
VDHCSEISSVAAKNIRDNSAAGALTESREILEELRAQGLLETPAVYDTTALEASLRELVLVHPDIREICTQSGVSLYYSLQSLTDAYATILAYKAGGPLLLVVEVVRDNSRQYARPVPVDSFRDAPFGLSAEDLALCLAAVGTEPDFDDIAQATTSIGTVHLYSTRHLDPEHAAMLAEWFDVGQPNNP